MAVKWHQVEKHSLFCWYYTILVVLFAISYLFHVSGPKNTKKKLYSGLQVTQVSPRAVHKKQTVKYLNRQHFRLQSTPHCSFIAFFPTIGEIDTEYSENWMKIRKIHTIPASMASEGFKYVTEKSDITILIEPKKNNNYSLLKNSLRGN